MISMEARAGFLLWISFRMGCAWPGAQLYGDFGREVWMRVVAFDGQIVDGVVE